MADEVYHPDTVPEPVDLVTIDVGWTPQAKILPAAARLIKPEGRVVTLLKPHYEAPKAALVDGVLPDEKVGAVVESVKTAIARDGWSIVAETESPLRGHGGNREFLMMVVPVDAVQK